MASLSPKSNSESAESAESAESQLDSNKDLGGGAEKKCNICKENKSSLYSFYANFRTNQCKDCIKVMRRSHNINPDLKRGRQLKYLYGISLNDEAKMFKEQGGMCKICKNQVVFHKNKSAECGNIAYIDHCHVSKRIRGILCLNCNSGLGQFKDSVENLESAIEYLKESKF